MACVDKTCSVLIMYDKDDSGQLSWEEFKAAVRKGGKLPADGPHGLSDVQLRQVFSAVDSDHSGLSASAN